jgi:hypothetical protein
MKKILSSIWNISYKIWLFLFVITAIICVAAMRDNNQTMSKLRQDVYTADQNNGDVNAALNNLRNYIYAHMNTSLSGGSNIKPPIQLKYTYQRLYDAQYNQLQDTNQQIYNAGKNACHPTTSGTYDPARLACIEQYAINHGVAGANINISPVLYEFDFASPAWSPDLAGWSLLIGIAFFLLFAIRYGYHRFAE